MRLQEVMGYLVLHAGVAHSRQHLTFLFWPDSNEAQAHSGRKVLYTLRPLLPNDEEYLQLGSPTVTRDGSQTAARVRT